MKKNYIDYTRLIDDAMHNVVKKALEHLLSNKDNGEHHFYISFVTNSAGVTLSQKLKLRYPEEMTIVLQHQFDKLIVEEEYFSVMLSFDGMKENIIIPYKAITSFSDPSVKFALQFRYYDEDFSVDEEEMELIPTLIASSVNKKIINDSAEAKNNVVNLDKFRRNKKT